MKSACECGHYCCKECKCSVNPDPVGRIDANGKVVYNTLCPCKKCESSEDECKHSYYYQSIL